MAIAYDIIQSIRIPFSMFSISFLSIFVFIFLIFCNIQSRTVV